MQESDVPKSSVYTIKDGNDESGVVDGETLVEADDLAHGGNGEEDESEDHGGVTKLVSRVLMRDGPGDEFHPVERSQSTSRFVEGVMYDVRSFRKHQARSSQPSAAARPSDTQRPRDALVVMRCSPQFELLPRPHHGIVP